jgi:hypothetical protein
MHNRRFGNMAGRRIYPHLLFAISCGPGLTFTIEFPRRLNTTYRIKKQAAFNMQPVGFNKRIAVII